MYGMRAIQCDSLAKKNVCAIKAADYVDYGRRRIADGVKPSTVNHDMSGIRVVLRHAMEVWEMDEVTLVAWQRAKTQMDKQGIVGKSAPRDRRPTPEEETQLRAHFTKQNEGRYSETDMVDVFDFQLASGRRISETCRMRVKDVDQEKRLAWVYNLKNPKGKGYHAQYPLLGKAWEIVKRRIDAMSNPHPEARVFPYNAKTCSQRFTLAKKALGIENLRLHDSRREALSRLFEAGYSVPQVQKVSLHTNPSLLLGTYTKLPPDDPHRGPAGNRHSAEQR